MSTISKITANLVARAIRNTEGADKAILEACQRAVRLSYSKDDMGEANYIIAQSPVALRGRAVAFFKRFGLVVVENRGELPLVKRVEDKKEQAKVFDRMASVTSFGLAVVKDADTLAANAKKAEERHAKKLSETTAKQRAEEVIRKGIKQAQAANDLDLVNALSAFLVA